MSTGVAARTHSRIGLWLFACALALRLLIAPGMMPVVSAKGITIELCTAQGAVEVTLPGQPVHDPDRGQCPFAALGIAPLLAAPAPLAAPQPAATASQPPALRLARPHIGAPAPPPPARGPPAFA